MPNNSIAITSQRLTHISDRGGNVARVYAIGFVVDDQRGRLIHALFSQRCGSEKVILKILPPPGRGW